MESLSVTARCNTVWALYPYLRRGTGPRPERACAQRFIRLLLVPRLMTVRDKVGRTRYVAFRLEPGGASRGEVSGILPPFAKLTRFDGGHGVLRTLHRDRDALLAWMGEPRKVGRLVPLATSGTLRKAALALPAGSPARTRDPRPRSPRAQP